MNLVDPVRQVDRSKYHMNNLTRAEKLQQQELQN